MLKTLDGSIVKSAGAVERSRFNDTRPLPVQRFNSLAIQRLADHAQASPLVLRKPVIRSPGFH